MLVSRWLGGGRPVLAVSDKIGRGSHLVNKAEESEG